jgi:acetyltransferase-like isoleucine patch superfamily enzyme
MIMNRIFSLIKLIIHLNVLKTLYFNFKVFPLNIAIRVPVYFYGSVKFVSLSGQVSIISSEIKHGMIIFGNKSENIIETRDPIRLFITGKLVFNGTCSFCLAPQITIWDKGCLEIGNNAWFGSFARIVSFKNIRIEENFLASWECQIFDTDFHFIQEVTSNIVYNNCKSIIIGKNTWIGSRSTILKGTITPNFCIIASNSVCNKDYSFICPEYSIIGGIPAKLLKCNVTFVNDRQQENKLNKHFWNCNDIKFTPEF